MVLRLGAPWVSKVVNEWLADLSRAGSPQFVVDPWWRWLDPDRLATVVVRADPTALCRAVIERRGRQDPDPTWADGWRAAEAAAQSALTAMLESDPRTAGDGGAPTEAALSEPALARRLYRSLPAEATMVVSSSMPVRDVEAFAPPRSSPPVVLANRGANGIDGVVSTSLGVALGSSRPTVALVGDLAFLHDCSALVRARRSRCACTIVVADNGGGGIFSFLPPAAALDASTFEDLFGTPQASDVAAVAAGFGLPWPMSATCRPRWQRSRRSVASGGMSVVRVRLPGRDENVEGHRRVNHSVVAAVDAAIERADLTGIGRARRGARSGPAQPGRAQHGVGSNDGFWLAVAVGGVAPDELGAAVAGVVVGVDTAGIAMADP